MHLYIVQLHVLVCQVQNTINTYFKEITTIIHINIVGRTLLFGLPRKQNDCPIGYITLLSVIPQLKCTVQRLWKLIYGLLMMAMLYIVGPLMAIKDPGKVWNRPVAKSRSVLLLVIIILILIKKFIPRQLIHGCRYPSINNTNKLRLLVNRAFGERELTAG